MKTITSEICPYCGSQMLKGYLKSSDLNWIENTTDSTLWRGTVKNNGGIALNKKLIRWPVYLPAYRCVSCKKIIFAYND